MGRDTLDVLPQVADIEYYVPDRGENRASAGKASADREWMLRNIDRFDIYLASLHVQIDRPMLERAVRLKLIATPTTGMDHIDAEYCVERNIEIINIRTEYELLESFTATAELAWGLLLASVRQIPRAAATANRGDWPREAFRGRQLSRKTLGVLGVGRLGSMVAEYGKAFRMRVLGCDPHPRKRVAGIEYVSLERLLQESDFISIHVHLTPQTRLMIGAREFGLMKDGVTIVNTSRGGIIDERAFAEALRSGKVAGAGLDVIDGEWRTDLAQHPLIRLANEHPNVVIAPHQGGATVESQSDGHRFVARKVGERIAAWGHRGMAHATSQALDGVPR